MLRPTDTPDPALVERLLEHEKQATRLSYLESNACAAYDALNKLLTSAENTAPLTPSERINIENARHNANLVVRSINARVVAHYRAAPK